MTAAPEQTIAEAREASPEMRQIDDTLSLLFDRIQPPQNRAAVAVRFIEARAALAALVARAAAAEANSEQTWRDAYHCGREEAREDLRLSRLNHRAAEEALVRAEAETQRLREALRHLAEQGDLDAMRVLIGAALAGGGTRDKAAE